MTVEDQRDVNKVYSERVRAGRRTYFFDIKPTRSQDYYLTITERKRTYGEEGSGGGSEKFKLFLYKEDLNKFMEALGRAIDHMKQDLMPDYDFSQFDHKEEDATAPSE